MTQLWLGGNVVASQPASMSSIFGLVSFLVEIYFSGFLSCETMLCKLGHFRS